MFANFLKSISITFVRHGTTIFNEQDRVQGTSNIPLSKKGFLDIENIILLNIRFNVTLILKSFLFFLKLEF